MAQRLATEYVKTCLVLEEEQLSQLLELFRNHHLAFKVMVLDNGDREILIGDSFGSEMIITYEHDVRRYILQGSCRFTDLESANTMRKALSLFKGDAIVNRIYEYYTLEYRYRSGKVVRIVEQSERGERLVYEHKDSLWELSRTFENDRIENEIEAVWNEVNKWLDRRIACADPMELRVIDEAMLVLSRKLFALEA